MTVGLRHLLSLAWALLRERVKPPSRADTGAAICQWARTQPLDHGDIRIEALGRRVRLVANNGRSRDILERSPADGACPPGRIKRGAMSFLAPRALTIAHGDDWARLRAFHERVLAFDPHHPLAQLVLDQTRGAFAHPVATHEDVKSAMGWAMLGIVVGEPSPQSTLAIDVDRLLEAVQSPLRRRLLGFRYRPRRECLYTYLRLRIHRPIPGEPDNLIDVARQSDPPVDEEEFIQQIPHWMFTFTGSGTDLIARTLAVITSRKAVYRAVLNEFADVGALDKAESIGKLRYTEACLLETGRLFPPATGTFHRSDDDTDIAHWFPLLHRDPSLDSSVGEFRPERWLDATPDAAADASCLFLRGPRRCPGRELIIFVAKVALARQLGEIGMALRATRLSNDPMPVSFPDSEARFRPRKTS